MNLFYLETCTPDYFSGFNGHVYAVPLHENITYAEVKNNLLECISQYEIFNISNQEYLEEEEYQELRLLVNNMFSSVTDDLIWDKYATDDSYAYFGIKFC